MKNKLNCYLVPSVLPGFFHKALPEDLTKEVEKHLTDDHWPCSAELQKYESNYSHVVGVLEGAVSDPDAEEHEPDG